MTKKQPTTEVAMKASKEEKKEILEQEKEDKAFATRIIIPPERHKMFWKISIGCGIAMALGIILSMVFWNDKVSITNSFQMPAGQLILGAVLLWIATSVRVIQADELAGVFCYGLPMIKISRGPKIIIWGVFQLERFNATVEENHFPGEPEEIQKTDDSVPLEYIEITTPDGITITRPKVRPIRITTGKPKESEKDDILDAQTTIEWTFWARWIIVDPFQFIASAGGDVTMAVKQMRDVGESCLNDEVTILTVSEIISGFASLQKKLEVRIKEEMKHFGIEIIGVGMTSPDLNHALATALRDIPIAKAKAAQTLIAADAEAYRLSMVGRGEGKATEEKLAGEGRGYRRAGKFIGVEPAEMLAAQVARDTIGEGDLILGTEGITQALGLGKKILQQSDKKE